MTALRAEFLKLFTTKLWIWLSGVVVVATGFLSIVVSNNSTPNRFGDTGSAAEKISDLLLNLSPIAYCVAIVIGILGITGEFRHQTATPTFLAVPKRGIVVSSKLAVYLLFGLLIGILFVAVIVVTAEPILTGKGFASAFDDPDFAQMIFGTMGGISLFGLFGVGVGALVRNQPAAITLSIIYVLAVEKLFLPFKATQGMFPYLPGSAAQAMTVPHYNYLDEVKLLGVGQGALLLAVWSLGLAIIGSIVAVSRDVT